MSYLKKGTIPICWNRLCKQNSIEMNLVMGWICHNPSVVYICVWLPQPHLFCVSFHPCTRTLLTWSSSPANQFKMLIKSYRCTHCTVPTVREAVGDKSDHLKAVLNHTMSTRVMNHNMNICAYKMVFFKQLSFVHIVVMMCVRCARYIRQIDRL